jgi:DNA-binding NtrC family response regulator
VVLKKILVIDDDSSVRECYGRLFRRAGFEPCLESCGISVERNLEKYRDVAIVVLDYRMPGINGLELLRMLRVRNFNAAAVLVTAFATPEMLEKARQLGIRRVLSKPVNVSQLMEAVEESLPPEVATTAGEGDLDPLKA